jgi:hypothetical protein
MDDTDLFNPDVLKMFQFMRNDARQVVIRTYFIIKTECALLCVKITFHWYSSWISLPTILLHGGFFLEVILDNTSLA